MAEQTNLDALIVKLPAALQGVARKYGPTLLEMTTDELWAWIELLIAGKARDAWNAIMARMDNKDLVIAGAALADDWSVANRANAARLALQREASLAVLRALLTIVLVMVGL